MQEGTVVHQAEVACMPHLTRLLFYVLTFCQYPFGTSNTLPISSLQCKTTMYRIVLARYCHVANIFRNSLKDSVFEKSYHTCSKCFGCYQIWALPEFSQGHSIWQIYSSWIEKWTNCQSISKDTNILCAQNVPRTYSPSYPTCLVAKTSHKPTDLCNS